ncbi:hypothetical protein [Aerococcus christensenii]|uniref:hypothetical protein n=1 Tax=Aerococcus christensenii TaxID=87541 RepID=UPI0007631CC7|nr:hypothetical protein [Aerococcus christensenii]AMB91957.1 hypothetical protein AWM71_00715 [Aerococcus christensenii]
MKKNRQWFLLSLLSISLLGLGACHSEDVSYKKEKSENPTTQVSSEKTSESKSKDKTDEENSEVKKTAEVKVSSKNSSKKIIDEMAPLIHQATDNLYKSKDYIFVPATVDESTYQVEVRRQSPGNSESTSLVAIYRYNHKTRQLTSLNLVTDQWETLH